MANKSKPGTYTLMPGESKQTVERKCKYGSVAEGKNIDGHNFLRNILNRKRELRDHNFTHKQ